MSTSIICIVHRIKCNSEVIMGRRIGIMSQISRRFRKWTADKLDLPNDLVFNLPRLTLIGGKQLYIENHRGVKHFSPELLHLKLSEGYLEVTGSELVIQAIMTDEIVVEGVISDIKYRGAGEK